MSWESGVFSPRRESGCRDMKPFCLGKENHAEPGKAMHVMIVRLTGKTLALICLFALQAIAACCFPVETPLAAEAAYISETETTANTRPSAGNRNGTGMPVAGLLGSCRSETELKGSSQEKRITSSSGAQPMPPPTAMPHNSVFPGLPREWRNSIRRVQISDGKRLLALTFDLCERANEVAGYDAEIVNCLRKEKVKATFFAGGKWMRSHPERAMQLMADPLFEVGNHGWVHENFRLLDKKEAEERFLRTQAQYRLLREEVQRRCCSGDASKEMENIPAFPRVFRFPFGTCNAAALDMLASYGVAAIQWDVVSGDPAKGQTARGITDIVLKQSKPGSIIVFHANGRGHGTALALPGLVAALRDRGFEFATVSELLRAGTPVVSPDCYELKPGDNLRYDKFK